MFNKKFNQDLATLFKLIQVKKKFAYILKSEHHHLILHIGISLGIKFQLKLTILIFLHQICPKRVFQV